MLIDISSALEIPGWMNNFELEWLAKQASNHNRILEIGSWRGRSTTALAAHTLGEVWALDNWLGEQTFFNGPVETVQYLGSEEIFAEFCQTMDEYIKADKLHIIHENSLAGIEHFKNQHGERFFDFIFIDGSHTYPAVKDDIVACLPMVRPGGIISGHDSWIPGVARAIKEVIPIYDSPAGSIWSKQIGEVDTGA